MEIQTIRSFRKFIRHIERELNVQDNSSCCHGTTLAQCHALLEIFENESMNLSELSAKLNLDKSTVSRTIEGLVRDGLVNRAIPGENRRKVIISLTAKGLDICNQINRESDAYFGTVLMAIPKKDMPVFLKSFEKIVKKMIESNLEKKEICSPESTLSEKSNTIEHEIQQTFAEK